MIRTEELKQLSRKEGIKKLNFGCGRDIKKGFLNVDIKNLPGIDKVFDFNKFPYPIKDNTFDYILAKHVLEHMEDWVRCMEELHRISKPNAIVEIHVPHFASVSAYMDPTHRRCFSVLSFQYFEKGHEYDYYFDYEYKVLKEIITIPTYYSIFRPLASWFFNKFQNFYEANLCYILRPRYIIAWLKVIKNGDKDKK